jgi:hypothetical protein
LAGVITILPLDVVGLKFGLIVNTRKVIIIKKRDKFWAEVVRRVILKFYFKSEIYEWSMPT